MKTSGSYSSIVQGVSQQVPHERGPGQCAEQTNLIPDPVLGLTRRHGSVWQAEADTGFPVEAATAVLEDTANYRSFEYSNQGVDYTILYRTSAAPVGTPLDPLIVYDRTAKTFLPFAQQAPGLDPAADLLRSGGVSAITAVGRYVFLAGHSVVPTASTTDLWDSEPNKSNSVVWVRGGAYARTFKVTAVSAGVEYAFEYKTPTSSYPGTLDTSGVPVYALDPAGGGTNSTEAAYITESGGLYRHLLDKAAWGPANMLGAKGGAAMTNVYPAAPANDMEFSYVDFDPYVYFHVSNLLAPNVTISYDHAKVITNPNYSKQVSDITNAYNTAVTNWIGTAAAAIAPEAIAEQLRLAAVAVGLTSGTVVGSHLAFNNVQSLLVDDGGDSSLIRGVANEIASIDEVSAIHMVGKVVKVRAKTAQEAFYLRATNKNPLDVSGSYSEVIWVEGAGVESTVTAGLLMGTVHDGSFCLGGTAAELASLTALDVPDFTPSTAGDLDTSPLPYFIGRKISYLGVFQDRLMIGSGAVLRVSKTGDYLNFFRSSLLTVPSDDPFEMLSQGSDDDELRHSQLYDRDIVIFGKNRQYVISGSTPLTPTSANMATMSSHSDAADLPPLAAGGVMFYGKLDGGSSSVHQIQPGLVANSPEAFLVSGQLDDYLSGDAIELAKFSKPAPLFLRATGARNTLFTFRYLDHQSGRKQDAWGRWDFHPDLGPVVGMQSTSEGLLVFTIREAHGSLWMVADLCPMLPGLSSTPYLDSQRAWADVATDTGSVRPDSPGAWYVAFDDSSEFRLIGSPLEDAAALFEQWPLGTGPTVGAEMSTQYTLTNPVVRDRNEQAITVSNLTVTKFVLSMTNSSGYTAEVVTAGGSVITAFNGRVLGDPNNIIGRVPVTDYQTSVAVGENTKKFTMNLHAITWLPFTLTAVEWVGQWFNRTQRF